jgi:hypothetical protein
LFLTGFSIRDFRPELDRDGRRHQHRACPGADLIKLFSLSLMLPIN